MDRDDQRCSISNMCHNESIEVVKNRGLDLRQRLKQPSVDLCHPSFPPLPLIVVDGSTYLAVLQVVVVLVLQVLLLLQVLIMRVTSATATATILPSHRCSVLVVILVLAKFQHLPLSLSSLICH